MRNTQLIKCDECEHEFFLNTVNIENAEVSINNQRLILKYFQCPMCNKIYKVLLIDKCTKELYNDVENIKSKIRKNRGSNDIETARMLNQMVNVKVKRLNNYIEKLNKKFPGTFIFVVSENNHKEKSIKYLP